MEKYEKIFSESKIVVTDDIIKQFVHYKDILLEWNQKINLTSITDEEDIFYKHFLDSLLVLQIKEIDLSVGKLIDVGTGAGFPGVPLAIFHKDLMVSLSDSLEKRMVFLQTLTKQLGLNNTFFLSGRAEDLARDPNLRESFDFATARAVSALPVLLEYLSPFVKQGGFLICYKGPGYQEELEDAQKAIETFHLELMGIKQFHIQPVNMERSIIIFKKTQRTDEKYPRRAGVPAKKPIR